MKTKLRNCHILARGLHFLTCWRALAEDVEIAEMTPDQLEAECEKSRKVHERIFTLETELRGLRHVRRTTDRKLANLLIRFACSVRGNPLLGEDCPFYRALGFIPKSENRSGRPRKPKS